MIKSWRLSLESIYPDICWEFWAPGSADVDSGSDASDPDGSDSDSGSDSEGSALLVDDRILCAMEDSKVLVHRGDSEESQDLNEYLSEASGGDSSVLESPRKRSRR